VTGGAWITEEQHALTDLLDLRLETDPDGEYLDVCGETFTAASLARRVGALAAAFADLGVRPGDRVATLCENSPEAVLAWWGAIWAGAIAVPINSAYKGEYLRHQLADSGASVLVAQDELAGRLPGVVEEIETLRHVVVTGEGGPAPSGGPTAHGFADLSGADPVPPHRSRPADLATFVYTGGTTGPSKGCMLSHHYHASLSRQIAVCWRRGPDDVVWTPLPLFHFNALVTCVLGPLVAGGRAAISRRFSVSGFWGEVNRVGATIASLLGSMTALLAADEDRHEMPRSGAPQANTTLRLMAAAPVPPDLEVRLRERFGVEVFSGGFGLTEASLISWTPPGVAHRPGAAGVVNDEYFEVRIFDDDDRDLGRDTPGEIVVRPRRPHVMFEGYWGNPEATVAACRNLWFHTGDIGRIDGDGYLFFVDRKADYLRRRGENISSFEVERVLCSHPDVVEAVVVAVPSQVTEDDLKATVVRRDGSTLTEEALFRWCIDQLPYFALPRYVEFRADLPRSPVGRVLKRVLRDEGVTPATWDAEAAGVTYERR
jgi:crotonobetaine/carnitine-CoA ligase